MERTTFTTYISASLKRRLKVTSAATGISIQEIVSSAIEQKLNELERSEPAELIAS